MLPIETRIVPCSLQAVKMIHLSCISLEMSSGNCHGLMEMMEMMEEKYIKGIIDRNILLLDVLKVRDGMKRSFMFIPLYLQPPLRE